MAQTVWEVADAARIPGTTTTVKLHPKRLSKGIKTRAIAALRSGVAAGGSRAFGAIIALKLARKFDLPMQFTWDSKSVFVASDVPKNIRDEVISLIQADAAAELLNPKYEYAPYIQQVKDKAANDARAMNLYCGKGDYRLGFFSPEIRKKARKLCIMAPSPERLAKAEEIIALLDKEDPITIETF